MPRQIIYNPQASIHAPRLPGIASQPQAMADNSASRVMNDITKAAREIVPVLGRAYVSEKTSEVDSLLLDVNRNFDLWKSDYQQSHQGRDAASASADYSEAWARLSEEAIKKQDAKSYTVFGDLLKQRLAERGAYALKDGLAYEGRQRELWKNSQEEAQLDEFYRMVQANPGDMGRIIQERDNLKGAMQARHPGLDLTAKFNQIDEQTGMMICESHLANGDTAAVRALLSGGGPMGQQGYVPSGGGPKPGSVSERNLANWNFGNVKTTGGGFASYASKQDGLMAIGERFLRYNNAPDRGWHAQTLREAMNIYAPPSENKTNAYAETLAGWMGINPDARIDFRDPEILAGFIQHVPRYEHGNFVKISREEALSAAQAAISGRKPAQAAPRQPGYGGMSLKHSQALLSRADAIDRKRQAELAASMKSGIDNYVAAARDGHIQDLPFSQELVLAAFGEEQGPQVWSQLEGARELALDMYGARTMNSQELEGLLYARRPDPQSPTYVKDAAYYGELARAVHGINKARAEDPALYAANAQPEVARARQAFLTGMNPQTASQYLGTMKAALASQGTPDASPLPKEDARLLAGWLSQSPNPAQSAGQLAQCFGQDFPAILKSISPQLAPDVALMASGMEAEPARLIMQARQDKDFDKKMQELLQVKGSDRTSFEESVGEACQDINQSFMAGGASELPIAIRKATSSLALQYMSRLGMEQDKAIEKASQEVIASRYNVVKPGGFLAPKAPPMRVPKDRDADAVLAGTKAWLAANTGEDIMRGQLPGIPDDSANAYVARHLARNGYWVTDGDESGLVLFLGGKACRRNDGSIIRMSWDELENLSHAADSMLEQYGE